MGKRYRKKNRQKPGLTLDKGFRNGTRERIPKTMVIRMGASDVGPSITQLVQDVRGVMEPHTASRLKERRSNRLRDYTTMAGPLGVTHFLLFSRSTSGNTNLRIAVTPRGPTLTFRVEKYSLCKDLINATKHPRSGGGVDHLNPPLLVMNNFSSTNPPDPPSSDKVKVPKHLESLATTTFQSLFPPISPQHTPPSSIRRVLLLNRESTVSSTEDETYIINFRHYSISSKPLVPISRGLKRLRNAEKGLREKSSTSNLSEASTARRRKTGFPNMASLDDVADFVLDTNSAGYVSASETEIDTDAEVEVLQPSTRRVLNQKERQRQIQLKVASAANTTAIGIGEASLNNDANERSASVGAANVNGPPPQKRAVKLTELGPRMRLRLLKVEEGLCTGKVLWHEYITKTSVEQKKLDRVWEQRKVEREERKRVQRENIERKKLEKAKGGDLNTTKDGMAAEEILDEDMDYDDDEWFGDEELNAEDGDHIMGSS